MSQSAEHMNISRPQVVMIAGPNGAGKTTTAMSLLPQLLKMNQFVNADEIARGMSPLNPASTAFQAGRIMLDRIEYLTSKHMDFAFETTASGNVHLRTLEQCRAAGYHVRLLFLYLSSHELAVERVRHRVSQGGHAVPEKDIIRRYYKGLQRFFSCYITLADNVEIYDNSRPEAVSIATKYTGEDWIIHLPDVWNKIQEIVHD